MLVPRRVDLLLISPPVANFGQATSAPGVLTAFLRARGWDVHQWDLAIDAFHHFHSAQHLRQCEDVVLSHGADAELRDVAKRVVAEIEDAKAALQRPGVETDRDAMRWALGRLVDAGVLLTAASRGRYEHSYRDFSIPMALSSFEQMALALDDERRNPFLDYMREHALERVDRERPRAIGISITYASQLLAGFTLAKVSRERFPSIPLVLGGAYLTATEDDVEKIPSVVAPVDAIILHDGEETLDAWLNAVLRDRGAVASVPGIFLPRGGTFFRTPGCSLERADLDEVPFPMWTGAGLDIDRYLVPRYPIPLPLSRGCYWGRCHYCNISSQTAATYCCRSVSKALEDIKSAIAETGSNWFDFAVDSFRPAQLWELSRAIIDEELSIDWGAEVLLDPAFKDSVIADLARSGCRCLRFGLESGSRETLREMNKPIRLDIAQRILESCQANGIRTAAMLIVGFPTETQSRLLETYDFLAANSGCIDFLTLHPFSLVKGSPMSRDPGAFGLYLTPQEGVLLPSLPFVNTNAGGLQSHELRDVINTVNDRLRDEYPDLGELWAAAIGGWMTFPACCGKERS